MGRVVTLLENQTVYPLHTKAGIDTLRRLQTEAPIIWDLLPGRLSIQDAS
jgi:hypothetical protein